MHIQASEICTRELAALGPLHYATRMSRVLGENIAALRKHLGDTQAEFASRLMAQQSYVSKWQSHGITPSYDYLRKMADLAGTSIEDFKEKPWSPPTKVAETPATYLVDQGETVEILAMDLSLSMGPGTNIEDYYEETPVRFDLALLRQLTRSPPERLRLARGIGDSMFPTLLSNDRVMIDTTQRMLNLNDRIYAVSLYGAGAIKRLRTVGPNRVLVISDNPNVENQEVDADDIQIAGRVIWFFREV